MEIDSAAAAASEEYQGRTYYFCSEACHQRFVAAPECRRRVKTDPQTTLES
jgi:YHS domain-containing protein